MKLFKRTVTLLMAITIIVSLAACSGGNGGTTPSSNSTSSANATESAQAGENAFPKFTGTDFDGNSVDESIFAKNDVTLLNFWFNGCAACVNEMPNLEKLNAKLREKNAELVGVNVEAGESGDALTEAKDILSKQGATYRNIMITDGDAKNYIAKIFGFPTTVLVDKNGNIIGEPIVGSIDDEKRMGEILKMVDDAKAGNAVTAPSDGDSSNDKVNSLVTEENNIFTDHKEVWDKVFDSMQKETVEQSADMSYGDFLRTQVEKIKDQFNEDELKTLTADITRIDEIEKQLQELDSATEASK